MGNPHCECDHLNQLRIDFAKANVKVKRLEAEVARLRIWKGVARTTMTKGHDDEVFAKFNRELIRIKAQKGE